MLNSILMQRGTELCHWMQCADDIVACSYGEVGSAAMTLYARVSHETAQSQMQAHLDHGWEVIA